MQARVVSKMLPIPLKMLVSMSASTSGYLLAAKVIVDKLFIWIKTKWYPATFQLAQVTQTDVTDLKSVFLFRS